ncbi:glycosyltransferase family 2 protein [Deminuibacter soli]|uniref:Glycosyltransferase family 2 protein n=1 Tax=Deminuibacter soli TaxID=2291815 RepID=A0A3E1NFE9_9BACT|nr:glycosyltransferase family 2 protein [Deminuibacter soli]RFM26689.1 glycosyltransferase family 2 protein [Deminuibacter soli]
MDMDKVYIVLLNYNAWQDTVACIQSILKQSYAQYEIVVVDNMSTNDSRTQLITWARQLPAAQGWQLLQYNHLQFDTITGNPQPVISFIWSDKNGGFAYGNNIGMRYSLQQTGPHFIWLLNNDTVVFEDTLTNMVRFFIQQQAVQKTGMAGCLQLYYHDPSQVQIMYGRYNYRFGLASEYGARMPLQQAQQLPDVPVDYLSGACMLTHSSVIERIGLMSEDYFLFFEELDLAVRLKNAGYALVYCKDARILHKHGVSINGGTTSGTRPFADYHHFRSEYIFVRKYYRRYILFYLLVTGMQLTNRLIRGRFSNLKALVKGTMDGLRYTPQKKEQAL